MKESPLKVEIDDWTDDEKGVETTMEITSFVIIKVRLLFFFVWLVLKNQNHRINVFE